VAASPSSTAAAGTGGCGAIDASATATAVGTSSARDGAGSVLGGWDEAQKKPLVHSTPSILEAPG
jgi:hypothetical protein